MGSLSSRSVADNLSQDSKKEMVLKNQEPPQADPRARPQAERQNSNGSLESQSSVNLTCDLDDSETFEYYLRRS